MKLHKSILITVAVMLALATNVHAQFAGTSTQFSKLNVALTVTTNQMTRDTATATIFSVGRTRIDNKALLAMFADWSGNSLTNWKAQGAQLIFDWDTYQAAIADRTGTNVLLYLGSTNAVISGTQTSYLDLDWFRDTGPVVRNISKNTPGNDVATQANLGFVHLVHDDTADSTAQIDIGAFGPSTEHYVQTWDGAHTFLHWNDTEVFKPYGTGEIVNGEVNGEVNGVITANGSGPGRNFFIYGL